MDAFEERLKEYERPLELVYDGPEIYLNCWDETLDEDYRYLELMYRHKEYEPDPNDEDVIAKLETRLDMFEGNFILRKYCTNQKAREEYLKDKEGTQTDAKESQPKVQEPIVWEADDLYGSIKGQRGPVGPNPLEIDPGLAERDKEPLVLTQEEKYYFGQLEPTNPPPESQHAPPDLESTLNPNEGLPEDPSLLKFYEEDFRLIPGDVIIFTKPRWKVLETTHGQPQLATLENCVAIYEDVNYFADHGQFRCNFLDVHDLEEGDLVLRFGNFNKFWGWNRHGTINFYMYWPGLIPPVGSGKTQLHPWYWIKDGLHQRDRWKFNTLPISKPPAKSNLPIGTKVADFQLRAGDVLIHYVMEATKVPPFDHDLECFVWDPVLAIYGIDSLLTASDRVLRHGMNFQFVGIRGRTTISKCLAHVELYSYDSDKSWTFLGQWTSEFADHLRPDPHILPLVEVPLASDVIFDRCTKGRQTKDWDRGLNIGGLVSFHEWELWKDYGKEDRGFIWYRDEGKYGMGNITMVLRFGSFDDNGDDWTWKEGQLLELFILNTRGSAWRRNSMRKWPQHLKRPKPNYSWQPYNLDNILEVSPNFKAIPGDVILRLTENPMKEKIQNPKFSGSSYNPHFDINVEMKLVVYHGFRIKSGDFLIRAGYEKNLTNPKWTNATVEAYSYVKFEDGHKWRFRGRDMFVYGTNYVHGGLKDVQKSGVGDLRVSDIPMINDSKTRGLFGKYR